MRTSDAFDLLSDQEVIACMSKLPAVKVVGVPSKASKMLAPPHALVESIGDYRIEFELFGLEKGQVHIEAHLESSEVVVMARKDESGARRGFFWVFGVPSDADLAGMSARCEEGVLEITIPKWRFEAAWA